ncbi:hypothetical protein ACFX2A_024381 [Malus domestica]
MHSLTNADFGPATTSCRHSDSQISPPNQILISNQFIPASDSYSRLGYTNFKLNDNVFDNTTYMNYTNLFDRQMDASKNSTHGKNEKGVALV